MVEPTLVEAELTVVERQFEIEKIQLQEYRNDARERAHRAEDFALFLLRSCFLLNGGGVLACVTFTSGSGSTKVTNFSEVQEAIFWFSCGLLVIGAAVVCFYLSTSFQSFQNRKAAEYAYWRSILEDSERPTFVWAAVGIAMRLLALAISLASLLTFYFGVTDSLEGVKQKPINVSSQSVTRQTVTVSIAGPDVPKSISIVPGKPVKILAPIANRK